MANNKAEITTLPLSSKLNMNKSKGTINTSYDMFNDCNAPIFGGNLSPMFDERISDNMGVYDKHGDLWTVDSSGIKRNNELILPVENSAANKSFDIYEFKECPYNFDQAILIHNANEPLFTSEFSSQYISQGSKSKYFQINGLVGGYLQNGIVYLKRCPRIIYTDGSENLGKAERSYSNGGLVPWIDIAHDTQYDSYPTLAFRLFKHGGEYTWSLVEVKSAGAGDNCSLYLKITTYDYVSIQNTSITAINLHKLNGKDKWDNEPNSSKFGAVSGLADSPQIIISKHFDSYYGITILNHRQIGKNGFKDCRFCNVVVNDNSFSIAGDDVRIQTGNTNWNIFVDDSYQVCPAVTYHDDIYGGLNLSELVTSGQVGFGGHLMSGTSLSSNVLTVNAYYNETVFNGSLTNFGVLSGLIIPSLVTNQRRHRFMVAGPMCYQSPGYNNGKLFVTGSSYGYDSMNFGPIRAMGMQSTLTLPSDLTSWTGIGVDSEGEPIIDANSLWLKRDEVDAAANNAQGAMAQIGSTKFRVLFNYTQGFVSGVSWAQDGNSIGTLMSQWDSIDDSFYIEGYDNGTEQMVMWKDARSGHIMFCSTIDVNNDDLVPWFYKYQHVLRIVADRYVVWNSGNCVNCYDIETGKKGHWSSDWNNRILSGFSSSNVTNDDAKIPNYFYTSASTASGVDVAYLTTKSFTPSQLLSYNPYQSIVVGFEKAIGVGGGKVDFFASSGTSSPIYKTSFIWAGSGLGTTINGQLDGVVYPVISTGGAYYNYPMPSTEFVKSFAGRFATKINGIGYSMVYDGIRPVGLYNSSSMVDNIEEFFIINSQYYAIVNDVICAISYNTNYVLNGIDQIIDVNGLQFIGAFPSCAYFYSPSSHSIYAFTGDADLQLFVQSDKITDIYWHLYAPNNEWIYLNTNNGLYILTQNNVFRMADIYKPNDSSLDFDEACFIGYSTDKNYNVLGFLTGGQSAEFYKLNMDYTGWDSAKNNKVIIKSAFYGPGDMQQEIFDAWYIKIANPNHDNMNIKVQTKLIRDNKVVSNQQDVYKPSNEDLDENDNYIIRYQPNDQRPALASAIEIESTVPINSISVSHSPNSTFIYNNEKYVTAKDFNI